MRTSLATHLRIHLITSITLPRNPEITAPIRHRAVTQSVPPRLVEQHLRFPPPGCAQLPTGSAQLHRAFADSNPHDADSKPQACGLHRCTARPAAQGLKMHLIRTAGLSALCQTRHRVCTTECQLLVLPTACACGKPQCASALLTHTTRRQSMLLLRWQSNYPSEH